ncbi:MAG: phospholipase [Sphingomonadales bacterium]|jgi:phospholipase C|nr:phospholipase [Sphingomonadales bacterium]
MPNTDALNAIQHVFVLMLENRSFDHMFALSGINGIHAATTADTNSVDGVTYHFQGGAPAVMPSDPSHGFCHVLTQLAGPGADCSKTSPYPARTNIGFVADYAKTSVRSGPSQPKQPLPPAERGKVMFGIDTPNDAPALYTLAAEFALCDQYYSSLPGPTWPNRFFVHGASSDGMVEGPGLAEIAKWEALSGFKYPAGSIFDRVGAGNYRLYKDDVGPLVGRIPQVAALKGINFSEVHGLSNFAHDLANNYVARYTFIEPAYGDIVSDTYRGGSSQHPMDGLAAGDRLVAQVYNAIRNSPIWESSLLIITYDEHGGFYDCGIPAHGAPPPGDGTGPHQNPHDFDFSVYGVRVPAVVVSPWIAKGVVDHTLYDHASVLATVERLFGLAPLTQRDGQARDMLGLLQGSARASSDTPSLLAETPVSLTAIELDGPPGPPDDELIPDGDKLQGYLFVARKAHRELEGPVAAMTLFQPVRTRGDARRYLEEVVPQLEAARQSELPG